MKGVGREDMLFLAGRWSPMLIDVVYVMFENSQTENVEYRRQ